jgi:hypothetical protein
LQKDSEKNIERFQTIRIPLHCFEYVPELVEPMSVTGYRSSIMPASGFLKTAFSVKEATLNSAES